MFIILFAILLLAWLGSFLVFHISGALIHLLLLFAVISLIAHFFGARPYRERLLQPSVLSHWELGVFAHANCQRQEGATSSV
jgi:hypothetical protein